MSKTYLYQVTLPYAVYGLVVRKGLVDRAAPIARWTEGREITVVEKWVAKKGGRVELVWEGFE